MEKIQKTGRPPRKSGDFAPIQIRATAEERAKWQALAACRGVTLSDLIRGMLERAAKR